MTDPSVHADGASPPGELPVVLLVEDEPMIQEIVAAVMEEAGFAVEVAEHGAAAIERLGREGPTIRALVTDINLPPGPDGWEVARRARERDPDIAVVYVTGDSAHQWEAHGVPNSVMITKPYAPAQVTTAVANLLNQS